MWRRFVAIPAASASLSRRASWASLFRASFRADVRLALSSFKVGFKGITFFQVGLFTRRRGLLIQCTRSIGITFEWELLYLVGKPCNASLNVQKRQEARC